MSLSESLRLAELLEVTVKFPAELLAEQVLEVVPVEVVQDTAELPLPVAVQVNCAWVRFQPTKLQLVRLGELTLMESTRD
jgi:hypothetical protein